MKGERELLARLAARPIQPDDEATLLESGAMGDGDAGHAFRRRIFEALLGGRTRVLEDDALGFRLEGAFRRALDARNPSGVGGLTEGDVW